MTVVWGVTHTERCAALPQGPPRSGVSAEETDSACLSRRSVMSIWERFSPRLGSFAFCSPFPHVCGRGVYK